MITTCPECETAFRINEEQLAARKGRVRCGKCGAVFDARALLRAEELPSTAGQSMEPERPQQASSLVSPAVPPAPTAADTWPRIVDLADAPAASSQEPPAPLREPELSAEHDPGSAQAAPEREDPLFAPVRQRRSRFWLPATAILAVALAAQAAIYYRGEIALLFPEARPVLAEFCAPLGCAVRLPRRADMISIESSDLQADPSNPGVMVLSATLRNRAGFPQTHPAIELTLTDTQDQPLARRVLQVQDYAGRSASVDTGFPGNSEIAVKVYMEASSLKATGYRLYLFYP